MHVLLVSWSLSLSHGGGDPSVVDAKYPPQLTVGRRALGGGGGGGGALEGGSGRAIGGGGLREGQLGGGLGGAMWGGILALRAHVARTARYF